MPTSDESEAHIEAVIGDLLEEVVIERAPRVNPYAYKNLVAGSAIDREYAESDKRLYNDTTPYQGYLRESPLHRLLVLMKAQGLSNREISRRAGVTEQTVCFVLRQPWARLRLLDELKQAQGSVIESLLKPAAEDSLFTIIDIMQHGEKETNRLNAANAILDRYLGKPIAKVEQTISTGPSLNDLHAIDEELKQLEQEEKQLRGN